MSDYGGGDGRVGGWKGFRPQRFLIVRVSLKSSFFSGYFEVRDMLMSLVPVVVMSLSVLVSTLARSLF